MIDWITRNLASIAIVLVIAVLLVFAVISIVRNRKKGKTCSCGCEGCIYSGSCNKVGQKDPEKK